ncbi:MAG: ABC transporter permease [Gemmatimonadaceae bacterium]
MRPPTFWLRRGLLRLRALLDRPAAERELDDEIRFHIEREAEERVRRGASPGDARRDALRAFGGVERHKDDCRDARGVRPLEELAQDLKYGVRALRKNPGFTTVVVLTLALGVGANTAVFSVVNGVLLRPLPYREPEQIVTLWQHNRTSGETRDDVSPANFLDWRERVRSYDGVAMIEPYGLDLLGPDGPESIRTWLVSDGFFSILGTPPQLGRPFRPEEFTAGHDHVVVMSDGMWRRRFGADPGIIGRTITLDQVPWTVIGVMPPEFKFPAGRELWAPRVFTEDDVRQRGPAYFNVIARLKPGLAPGAAQAELSGVAAQLAREYPRTNAHVGATVVPLPEQLLGRVRKALLVLLGAVGFVLLIACANVANLSLARAVQREREFAIRAALGAGRGRVVRQLAAESVLVAALGGAAGVLLAYWGVKGIRAFSPANLPRMDELHLDARVLGFALAASLATALVFGLAPALYAARPNLHEGLRAGTRGATSGLARQALRGALAVGEIALAMVLLVGAGLLARSFASLLQVDRGYRSDHVLAVTVHVWQFAETPAARAGYVRDAVERLAALPGVRAAGMTSSLPLAEAIGAVRAPLTIEGRPAPAPDAVPIAHTTAVTPGYFAALGIALRRGRMLARSDDASAPPVALINETMARRFWPDEDPIGKKIVVPIHYAGKPVSREIVGVVADVRHAGLAEEPRPSVFLAHAQAPTGAITFAVRTAGDPLLALARVRETIRAPMPALPVSSATTLDTLLADSLRERRFHLLLLGTFSLLALALAGVGVYGIMSHATSERTREIGVRMALGARGADVLSLVMRQGGRLALVGVAAGLAGAAALTGLLRGMLYNVTPLDAVTFAGVAALVLVTAALACYVPARRATRVDPLRALRAE